MIPRAAAGRPTGRAACRGVAAGAAVQDLESLRHREALLIQRPSRDHPGDTQRLKLLQGSQVVQAR